MRHWSVQTAFFFFFLSLPQCIHGVFIFHILRVCHRCCPDVVYQIKALFRIQYHFFFFSFPFCVHPLHVCFCFQVFPLSFLQTLCNTEFTFVCVCVVSGKNLWFPCVCGVLHDFRSLWGQTPFYTLSPFCLFCARSKALKTFYSTWTDKVLSEMSIVGMFLTGDSALCLVISVIFVTFFQ